MVNKLRFGIVGLGWVARDYMLPAVAALSERIELVSVLSIDENDFAGLPDSVACYTDLDAFLRAGGLDAVYIATPNYLHRPQATACLAAGLHVLCEKPLALTRDAVVEMQDAADAHHRLLVTAYDQRHHPAHRLMRERIERGGLGTVTQARIDYACWLPAEWSPNNWRIDRAQAGGGAIIDLAPHGIDLLEWLLGDPIVDIHCFQQTRVQSYAVDDGGVLSLSFRGGALASQTVSYNRPETLPRRRLEVIGTKGMLVAENTMGQDAGGSVHFIDAANGRAEPLRFAAEEGPFLHQLQHFADRVASFRERGSERSTVLRQVSLLERALIRAGELAQTKKTTPC